MGRRELELVERLVTADRTDPGEPFAAVYMQGASHLRHLARPQKNLGEPSVPALMALAAADLIVVKRYQGSRPGTFYLASHAEQALDELRAQLGQPTPLSRTRAQLASLKERLRRADHARARSACRFGRLVRWLVLPLLLALVALLAWATAGPGAGIGALIVMGILYAIITNGLGINGLQLAKAAEDGATRWADRRLKSWTDPDRSP